LIAHKLVENEAEKRGMSPQALLEAETRNVEAVTEQEIEAAYRQQKSQLNADEETAKEQIRRQLYAQKVASRERALWISYARNPWLSST